MFNLLSLLLATVLLTSSLVAADFSITGPVYGTQVAASSGVVVTFTDDGSSPAFTEISSTKVLLCTGPNSQIFCFTTPVGTFTPTAGQTSYSAVLAPLATLGSNGPYFFQFYSLIATGGSSIHYSPRFALSGMLGTYQASDGGDVAPPPGSNTANIPADQNVVLSLNQVPYTMQTGRTRYAPMQTQPGSKVTYAKVASQRYPTSAVTFFSNYDLQPIQKTTITPSWTYTIVQGPNWAATAAAPTGYYAASEALQRNINAKSRRGFYEL